MTKTCVLFVFVFAVGVWPQKKGKKKKKKTNMGEIRFVVWTWFPFNAKHRRHFWLRRDLSHKSNTLTPPPINGTRSRKNRAAKVVALRFCAMSKRDSQRLSRMYMGDDGDKSLMSQLADQAVKEKEKEKPKKRKECTEKITPFKKIGYEDMTKMEDMTLEAVLGNLKERYEQDLIYTYTSSILVAINPFKRLNCFTPGWVKHYKGKRLGLLSPHIFAVAEQAYANMIDHKVNQSVLVSGESGAGKTESTKLIMQFLSARTDRVSNIETMVLESIPVLEAFGNAKTGRNDNSSRFGKFIELQFSSEHYIVGSRMLTYLLEKSRLTFQVKFSLVREEQHYSC